MHCEIVRGAWCLMSASHTIELNGPMAEDLSAEGRRMIWKMHKSYAPPNVFSVVLEPEACKEGLADTAELLQFDPEYEWRGKK